MKHQGKEYLPRVRSPSGRTDCFLRVNYCYSLGRSSGIASLYEV